VYLETEYQSMIYYHFLTAVQEYWQINFYNYALTHLGFHYLFVSSRECLVVSRCYKTLRDLCIFPQTISDFFAITEYLHAIHSQRGRSLNTLMN
jgi:hypothetical protein